MRMERRERYFDRQLPSFTFKRDLIGKRDYPRSDLTVVWSTEKRKKGEKSMNADRVECAIKKCWSKSGRKNAKRGKDAEKSKKLAFRR
jgi:hypothetical protein